jgi:hypothetical protein
MRRSLGLLVLIFSSNIQLQAQTATDPARGPEFFATLDYNTPTG